jgi:putative ABC transport system permease protein
MFLAFHEIRRGPVRFSLLALAIGLLLFLVLFQQALQNGLITSFVGALRNQSAPVIVYSLDGQRTLQGSTIAEDVEDAVSGVDGVGAVAHVGQGTFTVSIEGAEPVDASVLGTDDPDLGRPTELSAGRFAEAGGEAVGSDADFEVGDQVADPGGRRGRSAGRRHRRRRGPGRAAERHPHPVHRPGHLRRRRSGR